MVNHTEPIQKHDRKRIWTIRYREEDETAQATVQRLSDALHILPVTARLLCNRGLTDPEQAALFLGNDDRLWHDPLLMADMDRAVERTLEAVRNGEKIAIYGDYDADGVTSVSVLYLYLTGLGADVTCYIPRRSEGYGMSVEAVNTLSAAGIRLILTVDTGVTAIREIAHAGELGMDTVVTDHHECLAELPDCCAVINPHRPDCPYPFKELAGVGVVFKLVCACEACRTGMSPVTVFHELGPRFLDLVSIGTIADVMDLVDENRCIVSEGLAVLQHTTRPGLSALLDAVSGSSNSRPIGRRQGNGKPRRPVNTGLVGYAIAPRLNAAGRMENAMKAVDLLLCPSPERAVHLAEELCDINTRRQTEENRMAEQAYNRIEADSDGQEENRVIVLDDDDWHQGVIGIVSSRLTETYGKPSILITFSGATAGEDSDFDIGKGSGRSVEGLNLVEALSFCEDTLVRYGGHEQAAGLTIRRKDIPEFRRRINEYAEAHMTDAMMAVRCEADCEVHVPDLTMDLARELDSLEPFGSGNPTPVFLLKNVMIERITPLGGGKHTKLTVSRDGERFSCIWFGKRSTALPVAEGDYADLLFELNINDFRGVRSLQLIIRDVRLSADYREACRRGRERLKAVCDGAPIQPDENIVPTRDDLARVFRTLRYDARLGNCTVSEKALMDRLNRTSDPDSAIGYVKMHVILRVLSEMKVCTVREPDEGIFLFEVHFDAPKTSPDASPLLCRLRHQLTEGSA